MQKKYLQLLHPLAADGSVIDTQNLHSPEDIVVQVPPDNKPDVPDTSSNNKGDDGEGDEPTTSIEDFLNVKAPDTKPDIKKELTEDGKSFKKEADPKVLPKDIKSVETPAKVPGTQTTQSNPNARDYSDIAPEDVEYFQKMGNKAFAKMKPLYLEHKAKTAELEETKQALAKAKEGGLPDSYYEHERGYQFDPQYQEAESNYNLANQIATHWRNQLQLIEEGKDWKDLSWDEAKGTFILSEDKPANASGRIGVLTAYQKALSAQTNLGEQVQNLRSNFKQKHSGIVEELKNTEKSWFPKFEDAKSQEAAFAQEIFTKLPSYVQKNPIGRLLAKAAANNIIQHKYILALEAQVAAKGGKAVVTANKTNSQQNPNLNDMGAHSANGNKAEDDVTMDDFKRVMEVG